MAPIGRRHRTGLHKLDKLQHVATDATAEAVPALLVERDMQRAVRLAAVVWTVAEERLR